MKILRAMSVVAAAALSGCVPPPYNPPPASASTATLDITMNNKIGDGSLTLAPMRGQHVEPDQIVLENSGGGNSYVSITVPGNEPVLMTYGEQRGNASCTMPRAFTVESGGTFDVYTGDVPPPPPADALGHMLHFLNPTAGWACVFKVQQKLANGTELPVLVLGWHRKL